MPAKLELDPRHSAVVADIGGTNARFALFNAMAGKTPEITGIRRYLCADYPTLEAALARFFADSGLKTPPSHAGIAVACPVHNDHVQMTNHHWNFSRQGLGQSFGFSGSHFINDFVAVSMALPLLEDKAFVDLGGPRRERDLWDDPGLRAAVLGPGTGLGVSGLVGSKAGIAVLDTEGGHAGFAPADLLEIEVMRILMRQHPRVSTERLVCGAGLVALYRALAEIEGEKAEDLSPSDVTGRAIAGSDPLCRRTLERFCAILGSVAGDIALVMGATSAVFIGGGIVIKLHEFLKTTEFRARFEAKGRFDSYMKAIPTEAVIEGNCGLIGAAAAVIDMM